MKKVLLIFIVLAICGVIFSCNAKQKNTGIKPETNLNGEIGDSTNLATLRVAVMPSLLSVPVLHIKESGLDIKGGFQIQIVPYSDGTLMNIGLEKKEWDVATMGTACIYSMVKYDAKVIGEICDSSGGIELFVRAQSEISKVKGYNPSAPSIYGSPDTVRGKSILCPEGTLSHFEVLRWIERVGVKENEVKFIFMDYTNAYKAFKEGKGDVLATRAPETFYAEKHEKWVSVATVENLNISQADNLVASKEMFENRKMILGKFLELIYTSNELLAKDPKKASDILYRWYVKNGYAIDKKSAEMEVAIKPLFTKEMAQERKFGETLWGAVDFMLSTEKINSDDQRILERNITDVILKEISIK